MRSKAKVKKMIQINDKLRIVKTDEYNLQLQGYQEIVNPRTKELRYGWVGCGWYGDVKSALIGALKKTLFDLGEGEVVTIKGVIEQIEKTENEIRNFEIKEI